MKTPNALNSASVRAPKKFGSWDGKMVSWLRQSIPRPRSGVVNSMARATRKNCRQAPNLRRGRQRLGAVLGRHFASPIMHYSLLRPELGTAYYESCASYVTRESWGLGTTLVTSPTLGTIFVTLPMLGSFGSEGSLGRDISGSMSPLQTSGRSKPSVVNEKAISVKRGYESDLL